MSVAADFMKSKPIDFTDPNTKHDRVLEVGDKKFYVVSGILSLWSDYFATLFEGDSAEASKTEAELKEIDPKGFDQVLKIIYDTDSISFGAELLVPLIDLSYYFLAPKVLDACTSYVSRLASSIDCAILVKLIDKACEKDLHSLKDSAIYGLQNSANMENFMNTSYQIVVNCANKYKLDDFKNWIGTHLAKIVYPRNFISWFNYSMMKDLPTLKAGIFARIPTWYTERSVPSVSIPTWYTERSVPSSTIPVDTIIDLVEFAFKHNISVLKTTLRKRIFSEAVSTGFRALDGRTVVSKNTFLENNLAKILTLQKEISEFIITSTYRNT